MESSGCSAIRRPRSHPSRKPRPGSHFFFELDNANEVHRLYGEDVLNEALHSRKGGFLQKNSVVSSYCKQEDSTCVASHPYEASKVASKVKEGNENQTPNASHAGNRNGDLDDSDYKAFKVVSKANEGNENRTPNASHRSNRYGEFGGSDSESFKDSRQTSHETSEEGLANGVFLLKRAPAVSNHGHGRNTKDVNQLVRQSHDDKVNCKAGLLSRTESHRKRVVPRKFHAVDTTTDTSGQKDGGNTFKGPNSSRHACMKFNVELAPKSERPLPASRKVHTKRLQNKVTKNRTSSRDDDCRSYPEERVHSLGELKDRGTPTESSCYSESGRHHEDPDCQDILLHRGIGQNCGEESSGEDAVSGSNDQSSPEVKQSKLMNCGAANRGVRDANSQSNLLVPIVRKSSRIPKKRKFDGDEDEPLTRPRKKSESEQALEQSDQEDLVDGTDNVELANGCYERRLTGMAGECELECSQGELFNSDVAEPFLVEKKKLPLTARQRALRISKEGGDLEGSVSVDPDVSHQHLPKRQKENLSEAEQAIRKEEAARRRKQQMEKNAKEIQASAIQKILGQESSRKKREEKLQKQRQEFEQEKQAAAMAPAVNSIRWVMGPTGNVVSFSQDIELPKIFSGPCSYPQAREKCAGPSCTNVYKYRDSKTRLPLCSLQCYRAVQQLPSTGPAF